MTNSFDHDLSTLAANIAKKAIDDTTAFTDKLDALGKLTAYYGLLLKRKVNPSDDEDEPTILRFREQLEEVDDAPGGQRVPARTRRRAS